METNEELAVLIQGGATEYIPQLWEQVRRFVEMRASRYARSMTGGWADIEDLTQSGYFAMLEAVQDYAPGKGAKFLTCLIWALKKSFAEVAGLRTTRRDAAQFADSLDAPLTDDPEAGTPNDLIADSRALEPFLAVEGEDYTTVARGAILTALMGLCDARKQRLILGMYFEGLSLTDAAKVAGYNCKQGADQAHRWVMRRLRHCSYTRSLRELTDDFDDLDVYAEGITGTGVTHWKQTGESATERAAARLIARDAP